MCGTPEGVEGIVAKSSRTQHELLYLTVQLKIQEISGFAVMLV